jgi:N4-gp56 family major capsid protein
MATIAEYNVTDLSDLNQSRYLNIATLAFVEASKWGITLPESAKNLLARGAKSLVETIPGNIQGAVTSATNPGSDFSYTTPTEAQVTLTWNSYYKAIRIDQASQQASVIELVNSTITQIAQAVAQTFDYHAANAAIASATANTFHYVGQTARASITATDILTLTDARKAHARLTAAHAPQFNIPGYGSVYLALVHPHVAYDLKNASSTPIFEGAANINAPNYIGNVLGYAAGFLWIEAAPSSILLADAGAGNVDVYLTMFMGANALKMVHGAVPPQNGTTTVKLNKEGSMVMRITYPQSHLGITKEVGFITNIGFGLVQATGTYRVEAASSLGANT